MISTKFSNECKNRSNGNRLGQILIDGVDTPITNSDNLQNFTIDDACCVNGSIIGTTYTKKLTASFVSIPNDVNLIDKVLKVKVGVKYDDSSVEYMNMGKYTVERPKDEQTANLSQITAYDDFYLLDEPYECGLTFQNPTYISDFYVDLCDQLNLTPKKTTFLNSDIKIDANPFINNETRRVVLQEIEKVACSFSQIDYDTNEIDLIWLSDEVDYEFNTNDYTTLEGGKITYGPVNCVVIKESQIEGENVTRQDIESIEQNGETQVTIEDSYFLFSEELKQQAIDNIWNRLKGLTYTDCTITTSYGKPFLKCGKKIKVNVNDGNSFETYVLTHTFTYDGTFQSVIGSPALTKQETKIKNESISQSIKKTEIAVDKANQKITSIVQQVDGQNEKISSIEQTVEQIDQKVSELVDLTREVTGNRYLEVQDAIAGDLINLKITGDISILPSKNIFPSEDLFPHDSFYLKVSNETESKRYKLPFYSLHTLGDVNDEFVIENGKAKLIRRLGVDGNDNLFSLQDEIVTEYDDIIIPLTDGYNKFELIDFPSAYLKIKYAIQSEYSDVFATKAELSSSITQTKDEINLEVSKKVDENEIISTINQSAEQIQINANKVSLEGKEINLTSDNIVIESNNFNVDKEGNMECNNATINGSILANGNNFNVDKDGNLECTGATLKSVNVDGGNINLVGDGFDKCLTVQKDDGSLKSILYSAGYQGMNGDETSIAIMNNTGAIRCTTLTQTSLKSKKKNFKLFRGGIELIKNSDVYMYNLKDEDNKHKKHIGLVIGDDYRCCCEVINAEGDSIDIYSMISVAWQAIKEQQNMIENLKKEVEVLKYEKI